MRLLHTVSQSTRVTTTYYDQWVGENHFTQNTFINCPMHSINSHVAVRGSLDVSCRLVRQEMNHSGPCGGLPRIQIKLVLLLLLLCVPLNLPGNHFRRIMNSLSCPYNLPRRRIIHSAHIILLHLGAGK